MAPKYRIKHVGKRLIKIRNHKNQWRKVKDVPAVADPTDYRGILPVVDDTTDDKEAR